MTDHDYLRRLPPGSYRAQAYVHWSMTIDERKQGWLTSDFYAQFREILTHTMFRYALTCPIYCCMPDHMHLLWVGIFNESNQIPAVKYFRKQINPILDVYGVAFQKQPYDHVLREEERNREGFETLGEYIARNPERAGLVLPDHFREYAYTGCLSPGYPELNLWQPDYWERFWATYSFLRKHGLTRLTDEE